MLKMFLFRVLTLTRVKVIPLLRGMALMPKWPDGVLANNVGETLLDASMT